MKKTLVLGASPNPERYSYKAVSMLTEYNHEAVPVGIRKGEIAGKEIIQGKPEYDDIHTVSMYLAPQRQAEYYDYIFSLKPERVIFNPKTFNPDFAERLKENNIEVVEACNLVLLRTGQF